jgi:hypothetical protein
MVASATYVTTSSLQKAIDAEKKRSHRDDFATSTRNVNMSDDDTPKAHPDIGNNAHSRALERNPTHPESDALQHALVFFVLRERDGELERTNGPSMTGYTTTTCVLLGSYFSRFFTNDTQTPPPTYI